MDVKSPTCSNETDIPPRKAFNNINIGYFNKILNVTLIIAIDLIFKLSTVKFYTGELQGLPSIGNRI